MKYLLITIILILSLSDINAQYEKEWQVEVERQSSSQWINLIQSDSLGVFYKVKWFDIGDSINVIRNKLIFSDRNGNEVWSYGLSEQFLDYDFKFVYSNFNRSYYFTGNKYGNDQFIIGRIDVQDGLVWFKTIQGSMNLGNLTVQDVLIEEEGHTIILADIFKGKLRIQKYDLNGQQLWVNELRETNELKFSIFENSNKDIYAIIDADVLIYDADGSFVQEIGSISNSPPYYNSTIVLNDNDDLLTLQWNPDNYEIFQYNSTLDLINIDSFFGVYPAFGDWSLFLHPINSSGFIAGGIDLADANINLSSIILRKDNANITWQHESSQSIEFIKVTNNKIFYSTLGNHLRVLNIDDGSIYFEESLDSLFFKGNLSVDNDTKAFYSVSTFFSKFYLTKYTEIGLSNSEKNRSNIDVYPNPTEFILNIDVSNQYENTNYTIYNMLGVRVMSGEMQGSRLNVELLDHGLYYLNIEGQYISKFMKI